MRDREAPLSSARPFLVLCAALFGEVSAGISYWWPAVQPGLNQWLGFSSAEAIALIATANSGSTLGVLGGLFHERFGSRCTAATGAIGLTLCFATISLLTKYSITSSFWLVVVLLLLMIMFSYMLYSSCLTMAVAVFPEKFRGRVVGLCSALYGASAGVFGSIQAAFFPTLASTPGLLLFVAFFCFIPAVILLLSFPKEETFAVNEWQHQSPRPISYQSILSHPPPEDSVISTRLNYGYLIALCLVVTLQLSAVGEILNVSSTLQLTFACAVITCIAAFQLLPRKSTLRVFAQTEQEVQRESFQSFEEVALDPRYLYLGLGFLVLISGGGIALLVQASNIANSRFYQNMREWQPDIIAREVRVYVIIFSACNVTARLVVGSVMDFGNQPSERLMLKFNIMHTASLVIALALAAITVATSIQLYFAVGVIGLCHGAFFSSSPALTTLWFGVPSFPRNFAILGLFMAIGSASLASYIPALLMKHFGSWAEINDGEAFHHICVGPRCTMPTFALLASLNIFMYITGCFLKKHVKACAADKERIIDEPYTS